MANKTAAQLAHDVPTEYVKAPRVTEKDSRLRKHFPVRTVCYRAEVPYDGDTPPETHFDVRPLTINEIPEFMDSILNIGNLYLIEGKTAPEIVRLAHRDVVAILDTVTVIKEFGDLDVSVGELPVDCLPIILAKFLDHISPKNWEALGETAIRQFGLTSWVEAAKQLLVSASTPQSNDMTH